MRTALGFIAALTVGAASVALADVLPANTEINNGGSPNWAIYFDLTSNGPPLTVTQMSTASTATAGSNFTVEVFTRSGSGLGNPGPGQSSDGWTSLGTAQATQGLVSNGISEQIDIPDIAVGANQTVGVAVLFTVAGPRYFGTGTPPYQVFSDANLSLTTGDSRSAPFTSGGSFFASRGLSGDLTYDAGGGGYTCGVTGSCPGTITVAWSGAEPGIQQGILFGSNTGSTTIPNGVCQGTVLGIQDHVRLVRVISTGSGAGQVDGNAGTSACGGHLQLVSFPGCATSTVSGPI